MLGKPRFVSISALTLAVLAALLLTAALPAQAQRIGTILYNFTGGSDGSNPQSSLTFDSAGNLYGTTFSGGLFGYGTVFELSPNGNGGWNETVLYSFTGGGGRGVPFLRQHNIRQRGKSLRNSIRWRSERIRCRIRS